MSRQSGKHRRRLAAAHDNGRGGNGRTIPVYVTEAEFHRLAAAAIERGDALPVFLKRAALALAQADAMHGGPYP